MSLSSRAADAPGRVSAAMQLLPAVVLGRPPSLGHCRRMLDSHGMMQFARGTKPDPTHGYCLDDNARAFLAAVMILSLDEHNDDARELGAICLSFAEACRRPDGRFHNLVAADGSFTDDVGSQDSLGRLIWACGIALCFAPSADWRERACALIETALDHADEITALHPVSYAALGLAAAIAPDKAAPIQSYAALPRPTPPAKARPVLERLCALLSGRLVANAGDGWEWFEPLMTWGNARMPEALLRGAAALGDDGLQRAGMRALSFLALVTHERDRFVPVGNRGWYERGGERTVYDQQPIEACAMVDAWLAAARLTDRLEYEGKALEAFSWFLGLNSERLALVDPSSGGCHDGLGPGEMNENMGAESTLSYVHAHAALAAHFRAKSKGVVPK